MCDVCKSTINNLPEVTPPAPGTDAGSDAGNSLFDDMDDRNHAHPLHGAFVADQMPGSADIVFDCIRVRFRSASPLHHHDIIFWVPCPCQNASQNIHVPCGTQEALFASAVH